MIQSRIRIALVSVFIIITGLRVTGQTPMPDELNKNRLKEQLDYIQVRAKIFDGYRAIREDMFQKLIGNIYDTLSVVKSNIAGLVIIKSKLTDTVDSLNRELSSTKLGLEEMTRTKNSISLFGLEVNKVIYNFILWAIIAGLIFILAMGFLIFKRNLSITNNAKKELKELKEEFEAYRKSAREAREKASMAHFNELKKLKGGKN
jgi:CO dehydrogenase/acetyl-CoA synthase alpha subunit